MRSIAPPILLLLAACAGAPASPMPAAATPVALIDTAWTIAEVGGQAVPDPTRATLRITGGRVEGRAVCNRFRGPVALDGTSLRFDALVGTRMACPPPAMDAERRIFRAFADARRWRAEADGGVSLLGEGDTVVMRLSR